MKAVHAGRLSKATRLCTSITNVAPPTPATLESLNRLHPAGPADPFGSRAGAHCPAVTTAQVIAAIRSTSYDTAGGPSGWSTSLLKTASKNEHFVRFLTKLTNMIANGTAPGARYLLASFMVPLQTVGSTKIRPIAIGEHFYRIAAKVLARNFRSSGDLAPCQLGVGTAGGVEPIVWKVQKAVDDNLNGAFLFLDLANAFNTMDRGHLATALITPQPASLPGGSLGVRLRFSSSHAIGVRTGRATAAVQPRCSSRRPSRPFVFLIRVPGAARAVGFSSGPPRRGFLRVPRRHRDLDTPRSLEPALSPRTSSSCSRCDCGGLPRLPEGRPVTQSGQVPNSIRRPNSGVRSPVLGNVCGYGQLIGKGFLAAKVEDMVVKTRKVLKLPKQAAFLLLRECVAPTLLHLLRCLDSTNLNEQWERASAAVRDAAGLWRGSRIWTRRRA